MVAASIFASVVAVCASALLAFKWWLAAKAPSGPAAEASALLKETLERVQRLELKALAHR